MHLEVCGLGICEGTKRIIGKTFGIKSRFDHFTVYF